MSVGRKNLNNMKQNQLVAAFLQNISAGYVTSVAAEKAGFATPRHDIARMFHNPEFAVDVGKAIRHRVATTLAPQAMKVAEKLMNDTNVSPRVRWDIAKTMLAAGAAVIPPKQQEMDNAPKEIGQMTGEDIMRLREQLQAEQARRMDGAKLIEHAPQVRENDSQQEESLSFLD